MHPRRAATQLSLAGVFAIAVTFGPARVNYGLFLPYLRDEFDLSTTALGVIASGLHAGNLLALAAVAALATRIGARTPVLVGLVSAAVGLILVAVARDVPTLAVGVILAGTGAGWTWSPYNDVVEGDLPTGTRNRVLAAVSTGGSVGMLVAGVLALVFGTGWRAACVVAAAAAAVALVPNARVLSRGVATPGARLTVGRLRRFAVREALPLYVVAAYFGVVDAFYLSFAVDLVAAETVASVAQAGAGVFVIVGVTGLVALATGAVVARVGFVGVLRVAVMALGLAALALGVAPSALPALVVSALLFGVGAMVTSALLSIWSSDVFSDQPSVGFTVALMAYGVGLVAGPAVLGAIADATRLATAFVVVAALAVPVAAVRPTR